MRYVLRALCLLFPLFALPVAVVAQLGEAEAVTWSVESRRIADSQYEIRAKATIPATWHLYSSTLPAGGPSPTVLVFPESDAYGLVGKLREEGTPIVEHDPVFDLDLTMYDGSVTFVQLLELKRAGQHSINFSVEYQTCREGQCNVGADDLSVMVGSGEQVLQVVSQAASAPPRQEASGDDSLVVFFIISFLAGLAGLLTPCVFPMIPMTVSFFLGKKNRVNALLNALTFGFSIVGIYTLLGFLVSLAGLGAGFITDVTTHWITNLIFFLLFAIFGAAFFGMFEIRLPSNLSSKTDSQVDRGGFLGSFFFALTTVIVSLSCVGPIVGGLLIEGASGASVKPVLGMFAFSLGFSLPFTLFAIFPSWLDKLPKSGGWMNSVKIVLGFIVLAFSLKFLLGVDTYFGLGVLSRPIFIAIWVALAIMLTLYLLGFIRFKLDSQIQHVGFLRMLLAVAVVSLALYLSTGLFGAPLSSLSGFMPAPGVDDFSLSAPAASQLSTTTRADLCEAPKYADFIHMPAGIEGYRDYKQAIACAKQKGKPVLVEFTGHGCSNCKVMVSQVLSKPQVASKLMDQFIVAALYVDEKFELPQAEWYVSPLDGKEKKTIGRQNLDLQASKFKVSGQPYFFVVSPEEEVLAGPYAFDTDPVKFLQFLDQGLAAFSQPATQSIQPQVVLE